ncbi:MAG TPA: VWA domain-containing protein [Gemmatimonadaceae bacterium]|nr:VWA domain-containing protein [Gemmatimonadaceae bacterium]
MLPKHADRCRDVVAGLIVAVVAALASSPGARAAGPSDSPRSGGRPQEAASQTPAFRAGASAVVLDVVIRDKRGRPVRDVKPGEVTLLEDGVVREIRSFRLVERTATPAAVAPAITPPQPAGETRPDALRYPTLVTLVFDHLTQNSRVLARRAALQFIAREIPPDQWVAVYALDQRLRLAQTFTRDPAALRSAIERATAGAAESRDRLGKEARDPEQAQRSADAALSAVTAGPTGANTAALGASIVEARIAEVTARMERMVESADIQQRGQSTLFPLMALMKAQGTLAGRKALLFFSEGLPIPLSLEEAYRSVISEANRANVSLYAVDARGLDAARSLEQSRQMLDRSGRNSQSQQAYGASSRPVTMDDVMNSETAEGALRADTQNALRLLAEETSGTLIANTNDLGPQLVERVSADLDSYYEVGYAPSPAAADGHFRSIAVKLSRPGLTVHSRSGYFALPETDAAPLLPSELPMLAALAAEPPPHPFEYSVAAFRFDQSTAGLQHALIMEVPLNRLTFQENRRARTYTLRFTAMAVIKDSSGAIVQRFSESYPLEGPLDRVPALQRGRIRFKRQFWLPPGRYTLWAIARDQATEQSSVKSLPLEVPDRTEGIRISELSVIRSVDQAGDVSDFVDDPFRTDALRITPALELQISKAANTQVSAYVTIYPGDAAGVPGLTFEFMRDGKVIGRSAATLPAPDAVGRIKYVASFPTEVFAPGEYGLRAIATKGAASVSSQARFVLIP